MHPMTKSQAEMRMQMTASVTSAASGTSSMMKERNRIIRPRPQLLSTKWK